MCVFFFFFVGTCVCECGALGAHAVKVLQLESQVVVNCLMLMLGTELCPSAAAEQTLNC